MDSTGKPTPITLLCPILRGSRDDTPGRRFDTGSRIARTRAYLQRLSLHDRSPMAKVPNTFLCRFFILDDVFFEGYPAQEEHLENAYLVFCCNCYGSVEDYMRGFWQHAEVEARSIWRYCVGFENVNSADDFWAYIKKCLIKTTFYFNGSSGEPLAEQLKALYLKQEFSQFVRDHQGASPAALQQAFAAFIARARPADLDGPTWQPGKNSLQ